LGVERDSVVDLGWLHSPARGTSEPSSGSTESCPCNEIVWLGIRHSTQSSLRSRLQSDTRRCTIFLHVRNVIQLRAASLLQRTPAALTSLFFFCQERRDPAYDLLMRTVMPLTLNRRILFFLPFVNHESSFLMQRIPSRSAAPRHIAHICSS